MKTFLIMATTKRYTKEVLKEKLQLPLKPISVIVLGTVIFIILSIAAVLTSHTPFKLQKPIPEETERTEMKTIPADVKKAIIQKLNTASPSASIHVPILMYHYVEYVQDKKDTERQLLNVTPNIFEKQIQTLIAAHYSFITAKDLGDILDGEKSMPQNPIILTFDDGHWDLATSVLPILKKYNIHATAYIVPGFIGTNTDSLTPQEMQQVVDSGLIDVGAHTVHHLSLKGKPLATVQYEIIKSKQMLENTYHIHVYSFAYPYGSFDQQAINIVEQAGFTTAASTIAGNDQSNQNRFFLFRVRPGYFVGQALLNYLNFHWQPYKFNAAK